MLYFTDWLLEQGDDELIDALLEALEINLVHGLGHLFDQLVRQNFANLAILILAHRRHVEVWF